MQTEIVRTSSRLAEVGPAWDALWRRGDQSVFQSHGWVAAWWNSRRADDKSQLCVGLCWAEGELVAVMPFATRRHRGVRVLEWAAKDCSDYCDALVDRGSAESCRAIERVWAAVVADAGFDLAYLSHVRPDAALYKLLDGQQQALRLKRGQRSATSRQVDYTRFDGQAWFGSLNEEMRDNHAHGMRVISEMGPVSSKIHGSADAIDGVIERMIDLKRRWLADTGQGYTILDDGARMFRAIVKELARQNALQIFSLHCGDALVAALLNIKATTRKQVFFATYDPRFAHALPEALAMVELIIRSLDMGMTQVDLLCIEDDSAFAFTNARIDLASYVGSRTLIGAVALAVGERLERAR